MTFFKIFDIIKELKGDEMKKILFLFSLILLLNTGCTMLKNDNYENILSNAMDSKVNISNTFRAGYKYYLPKGMKLLHQEGSNEIIGVDNVIYYMYVDRVSYFNRIRENYEPKSDVVYSKSLSKDNLFGYIEIKNTENGKYFLEIMYNYAKIEVIVEKKNINDAIAYAISILSSIIYQDEVLTSLMGEDILQASEVEHNIFKSADTESGYLQIVEQYGQYEEDEEVVDPDFIR